jgi:hypothetical protein
LETRVELVDRSRYVPRILSEARRVGPGGEQVTTRDVVTSLEGARESMFVQDVTTVLRRFDDAQGFVARVVTRPRRKGLVSTPREFFAAVSLVTTPECAIPFVETDHVFDAFERAPRRPRRALGQLVAQRRAVEGVGR